MAYDMALILILTEPDVNVTTLGTYHRVATLFAHMIGWMQGLK